MACCKQRRGVDRNRTSRQNLVDERRGGLAPLLGLGLLDLPDSSLEPFDLLGGCTGARRGESARCADFLSATS